MKYSLDDNGNIVEKVPDEGLHDVEIFSAEFKQGTKGLFAKLKFRCLDGTGFVHDNLFFTGNKLPEIRISNFLEATGFISEENPTYSGFPFPDELVGRKLKIKSVNKPYTDKNGIKCLSAKVETFGYVKPFKLDFY